MNNLNRPTGIDNYSGIDGIGDWPGQLVAPS